MKFNIELIDNAKDWYKMYSVYAFILLGLTPDLYNLAIQSGFLNADEAPAVLARIINTIAFFGGVLRMVKQKKLELDAAEAEPKAG